MRESVITKFFGRISQNPPDEIRRISRWPKNEKNHGGNVAAAEESRPAERNSEFGFVKNVNCDFMICEWLSGCRSAQV
jgi:hypothetical protein